MSNLSGEIDFASAIKFLKNNLIAVFDSSNPSVITGFTNRISSNLSGGEVIGMITFGCGADSLTIPSFQKATLLCGGMSSLLFLFAKVC